MYTNAQYQNNLSGTPIGIRCEINGAISMVPLSPANLDFAAIMVLVANNQLTIAEADPPPLPGVPQQVAIWQFMMAAWKLGFVTQAEALAAVKDKIIPAAFAAALSDLPAEIQAEAALKFAGITRMVRSDPLFAQLVAANIATDEQIDAVFSFADSIT